MTLMLEAAADGESVDDTVIHRLPLPYHAASVPAARVLLGGMLAGFSRVPDALVVVTELMGHAMREWCACCPCGPIEVVVRIGANSVRIEVGFGCSDKHGTDYDEEMGHAYIWGVTLVRDLVQRWGQDAFKRRFTEHQTWWAEMDGEWP